MSPGRLAPAEKVDDLMNKMQMAMAFDGSVTLDARLYEDAEDCLAMARQDVAQELAVEHWELEVRWADDSRNEIVVTKVSR